MERASIFRALSEFEHQFSERAQTRIEQLDARSNTKSSQRVNFGKQGIGIFSHYKFIKTISIMDYLHIMMMRSESHVCCLCYARENFVIYFAFSLEKRTLALIRLIKKESVDLLKLSCHCIS